MATFLVYVCAAIAALGLFVVTKFVARFVAAAVFQTFEVGHPRVDRLNYHVSGFIGALAAPVIVFLGLAAATSIVSPPPTKVQYADLAIREDATFWQRNATWAALNTGMLDTSVTNRFLYTKAVVGESEGEDAVYMIGLPGVKKWYLINGATYSSL